MTSQGGLATNLENPPKNNEARQEFIVREDLNEDKLDHQWDERHAQMDGSSIGSKQKVYDAQEGKGFEAGDKAPGRLEVRSLPGIAETDVGFNFARSYYKKARSEHSSDTDYSDRKYSEESESDSGSDSEGLYRKKISSDARSLPHLLKRTTISDDRSEGSGFMQQRLALRALKWNSSLPPTPPGETDSGPRPQQSQIIGPRTSGNIGYGGDPGFIKLPGGGGSGPAPRPPPAFPPMPQFRSGLNLPTQGQNQPHYHPPPRPEMLPMAQGKRAKYRRGMKSSHAHEYDSHIDTPQPDDESNFDLQALHDYIIDLQKLSQDLEKKRQLEPSKLQVLYRVLDLVKDKNTKQLEDKVYIYIDRPQWVTYTNDERRLRGHSPISNLPSYLDRNRDIAFVVFRDFDATQLKEIDQRKRRNATRGANDDNTTVIHSNESIALVSYELKAAVTELLESSSQFNDLAEDFYTDNEIAAPYLLVYHTRTSITKVMEGMDKKRKRQLSLLLDYVNGTFREEYERADSLLSRGVITWRLIRYLFKPDDIVVQGRDEDLRAFLSKSFPRLTPPRTLSLIEQSPSSKHKKIRWNIEASSWRFDKTFRLHSTILTLDLEANGESERRIESLDLRPLAYVQENVKQLLERRGKTFWKCRNRHFVSLHNGANSEFQSQDDERFIIDTNTYHELHRKDFRPPKGEFLDPEAMARDTPPDEIFVLLLPPSIKGFNLRQKKWLNIPVDKIREISWNKGAFKSLVLDRKTKDLIHALVSNQISTAKSTDLISGKGNGLVLLLHGGPGTGKTLTAESVAEIAEKPLYRVTCGDIGTHPEDVEEYLESVLYLGKKWDCIVLLDEADVFLEERSLADLQRNALVSVFLRMLEYYDGILILTSNRVGTFDEAFKSRIQLALHYENLSTDQRRQIWENFFMRLESLEETNIDFDDLRDNIGQLAKRKMNGRQIRNAITTARQSMQWKTAQSKKTSNPKITLLNYENLMDIIETSGKFDLYLDKLNGGNTQDQLAEDAGLRLAQRLKPDKKKNRRDESDESD